MSSKSRQQARPATGQQFWRQFAAKDLPLILRQLHAALRQPCLLCSGKATVPAVFQPSCPEAWGGRSDKHRLCIYSLCDTCMALPGAARMLRVEARLQQQLDLARRRN